MNYKLITLVACLAFVTCGCGTVCTRSTCGYNTFGARPYEAVAQDVMVIGDTKCESLSIAVGTFCFISAPIDIVLDTAGLPIDLVAWMYDCKKQPAWHFTNNWF